MHIVSTGDNVHEMSKPFVLEKLETYFKMSSAEFAHRKVNDKYSSRLTCQEV